MPYAGQQGRTIKALSDDDITALRNGEGMGALVQKECGRVVPHRSPPLPSHRLIQRDAPAQTVAHSGLFLGIARLNAEQIRLSLCTIGRIGSDRSYVWQRPTGPPCKKRMSGLLEYGRVWVIWNRMDQSIAERSAMRSEWLVHLMRAFPTGAVSRRRE
jgi:hypothetical protein